MKASDRGRNVKFLGNNFGCVLSKLANNLLNLLYNMPSECCDEYKLIQLYQKSSVWCFAFSHTSTFELIPAVATAQPGALVTVPLSMTFSDL